MADKYLTVENGETLTVVFDFSKELEIPWRPEYQYGLTNYVTIGSYIYECTNAGKSGKQLSDSLTTTIAATETDGTVEWTCRDWATTGSDTISTKTVTASSGLTVDSSTIAQNLYVDVTFTATAIGRNELTCQITTAAGETLKAIQTVLVK